MASSSVLQNKPLRTLTAAERFALLETVAGMPLPALRNHILNEENARATIENLSGEITMPVGIAGPLRIEGKHASGIYYLPLATAEGALVASVSRGCKALPSVTTCVTKNRQTRAPLFTAATHREAVAFVGYVSDHFDELTSVAEKTSRHLSLHRIQPFVSDATVWLRMEAETGEAMGMNMITLAAQAVGEHLARETGVVFESVSGNLCCDKKPAMINVEHGRGKSIVAEAVIPAAAVDAVLKTTPERIARLNHLKNHAGSELAGSLGKNAHHANIVAALFLATGQDMAHVVEGSLGTTDTRIADGNLHFSVMLPCLQTGTIGGGTRLPAQRNCLQLLRLVDAGGTPFKDSAQSLAEIVAAAVLAGELSLLAAETSHQLAAAHQRLNR